MIFGPSKRPPRAVFVDALDTILKQVRGNGRDFAALEVERLRRIEKALAALIERGRSLYIETRQPVVPRELTNEWEAAAAALEDR